MKRGVIYSCAGSQKFLCEAIESAKSVKKFMPDIEICLFHNYEPSTLLSLDTSIFTQIKKDGIYCTNKQLKHVCCNKYLKHNIIR